jgi:hypothetical protein
MYITTILRGTTKKKTKIQQVRRPKTMGRLPSQAQSHGLALEASASGRCYQMRSAIGEVSRANFISWGISGTGSMTMLTRTMEILMTKCDSLSASAARSLLILSTRVQTLSSSIDKFHPLMGRMPPPSPPLVSPLTTLCPSSTSREGSDVPPMSS